MALTMDPLTAGGNEAGMIAFLAVWAVLLVGSLVSLTRSRPNGGTAALWILVIFLVPFAGSVLWFLIGRRSEHRSA